MSSEPPNPSSDPFAPPAVPTTVGCLHCGEVYDSYLIEWRVYTNADGAGHGFWCCPIPGCDGKGFGFDIFPTDPDYFDENLRWVRDDKEEDDADAESNGFHDGGPERPPETDAGDEDVPW